MAEDAPDIVIVERRLAAVGGELHADAEQLLLQSGSRQADLWGANYYPGRGPEECIEYTSLITSAPPRGIAACSWRIPACVSASGRSRSP
ncbi:MAG TPA: DUF5674 family protein [Thermoanaerobaculia bacterium]|jgi:hypothetical protein|nr:DUF5674 family protein [Thermoanaerobaculia bacterium]